LKVRRLAPGKSCLCCRQLLAAHARLVAVGCLLIENARSGAGSATSKD
jgi:hypothetical protein